MAGVSASRKALLLIPLAGIALLLAAYLGRGVKTAAADEDFFGFDVPAGLWGGPGIEIETTSEGATLQFDCASGTIETPIALNAFGNFDVPGSYLMERDALGNRVRELHPARFQGTIHGDFLGLTVVLSDTGTIVGVFSATRGMRSSLHPCW